MAGDPSTTEKASVALSSTATATTTTTATVNAPSSGNVASASLLNLSEERLAPRTRAVVNPHVNAEDFIEDPRNEPKSSETTSSEESQVSTGESSAATEEDSSLSDKDLEQEHRHQRNNKGVHHHGHLKIHGHLRGKNFQLDNGVKLYSRGEVESGGYDEYDANGVVVKSSIFGGTSSSPPPPGTKSNAVFTSSAFEPVSSNID
jgi:hypothetical protein